MRVGPRRVGSGSRSQGPRAGPAEVGPVRVRAVDESGDAVLDTAEEVGLLRLRDPARGHRLVELLLGIGDEGVDEAADRLAAVAGHLGERLAALELRPQLGRGHAEIARRGVEAFVEQAEAVMEAAVEQREVTRLDPLLERDPLVLRQATGRDRGVDPVAERFLERARELVGRDAELFGGIVDDRLALLARRSAL